MTSTTGTPRSPFLGSKRVSSFRFHKVAHHFSAIRRLSRRIHTEAQEVAAAATAPRRRRRRAALILEAWRCLVAREVFHVADALARYRALVTRANAKPAF